LLFSFVVVSFVSSFCPFSVSSSFVSSSFGSSSFGSSSFGCSPSGSSFTSTALIVTVTSSLEAVAFSWVACSFISANTGSFTLILVCPSSAVSKTLNVIVYKVPVFDKFSAFLDNTTISLFPDKSEKPDPASLSWITSLAESYDNFASIPFILLSAVPTTVTVNVLPFSTVSVFAPTLILPVAA